LNGKRNIFYLRDSELPIWEQLSLYCSFNEFPLISSEENTFAANFFPNSKDIYLIIVDYTLIHHPVYGKLMEQLQTLNVPLIAAMIDMSEKNQIEAFSQGVDDLIDREKDKNEVLPLICRFRSLMEFYGKGEDVPRKSWLIGPHLLVLNFGGRLAEKDGFEIHFTPTEWNILRLLCSNKGVSVSRETILSHCFDSDYGGFDRSIDVHIKNLRKKIPGAIETLHGVGYLFTGKEI
jgi:DNA-binding response OmpR family regulator